LGNYNIVRLDLMKGHALSYEYDTAIENGVCAEVDYATNHVAVTTANTNPQVLVASVCTQYNSEDESDFRNELGTNNRARCFSFEKDDIFTTTAIDYSGNRAAFANVVVGDYATAHATDGKFTVNSAATAAAVQEFRVIEKTTLNGKNAVVLQCIRAYIS
jgi:hypothetical protein